MGIVYEAFQESLGRHVAVKVLPRQSLLDPKHLQRFQRESQTAARLHHTNIVPVFGVGEQDGFHYIVMQLIRGVGLDAILAELQQTDSGSTAAQGVCDITQTSQKSASEAVRLAEILFSGQFWKSKDSGIFPFRCDEITESLDKNKTAATAGQSVGVSAATEDFQIARSTEVSRSPDSPGRVSTTSTVSPRTRRFGPAYWRSVAAIGLQVADALHYAHAHHTLHRDIKPANLLLDSQGVVWITDFGLAKAMEQDNVTQTGGLVGTLRYMAPEQFFRPVRRPQRHLQPGLDALRVSHPAAGIRRHKPQQYYPKDHARRTNPPAQDQSRHPARLGNDRPEGDRPRSGASLPVGRGSGPRPAVFPRGPADPGAPGVRRRKALAVVAAQQGGIGPGASTLALLVLVAVVASVGYVRTKQANNEEAMQRKKAENTSALALEALDNIFQQFAPDRTASASALTVVDDTGKEITVPVQPVLSKEAAALLERMLAFYDRLAAQGGDDARLRRKVAEANRRVGDIRQRLGHYEESKAAYLRAIDLYKQLAEASGG